VGGFADGVGGWDTQKTWRAGITPAMTKKEGMSRGWVRPARENPGQGFYGGAEEGKRTQVPAATMKSGAEPPAALSRSLMEIKTCMPPARMQGACFSICRTNS
jgi:hypothetical protein